MRTIVGIDPGKTSAIAMIDLSGRLILSAHKRFAGIGWMIYEIRSAGAPVIIAGDRPDVSEAVKKVNAAFNARLFYPDREMTAGEKRLMAKDALIKDPHERDAYSAAIKAYKAYASKFRQAERIAQSLGRDKIDDIKAKVVGRYSISEAMADRRSGRR